MALRALVYLLSSTYGAFKQQTKPLPRKHINFDIFGYFWLTAKRIMFGVFNAAYHVYVSLIGVRAYRESHISAYAPLWRNKNNDATYSFLMWAVVFPTSQVLHILLFLSPSQVVNSVDPLYSLGLRTPKHHDSNVR